MGVFDKASLALVPDGIKDGKLYSIKPTDGSGDFTFTRGSNLAATRVDENGLIEKGRENLLLQSNQFDTTWTDPSADVTGGQEGRDGTADAWEISLTGAYGQTTQFVSASGVNTFSFYAKSGTSDFVRPYIAGPNKYAYFDLLNGQTGTQTGVASSIEDAGNGWWRCIFTVDGAITEVRIHVADSISTIGTSTSGSIYIQDAQLEQGLVATDYIETGATTVQAGILEDLPRIDYTGGTPSLLMEPSRTNLIPNSEYANGGSVSLGTITDNVTISPEGVQNAARFVPTSGFGRWQSAVFGGSITNGTTYVTSMYFNTGSTLDIVTFYIGWDGATGSERIGIKFNPSTRAYISTFAFGSATLTDYNISEADSNGWYRVSLIAPATNPNVATQIVVRDLNNIANNSDFVDFYGWQMEQGSYPTSYIPTYGASVTRGAEIANTVSIPSLIGQTEGTFFLDFEYTGYEVGLAYNWIALESENGQERILIYKNPNPSDLLVYLSAKNSMVFVKSIATISANTRYKIAFRYSTGDQVIYLNGILKHTSTHTYTRDSDLSRVTFNESNNPASCRVHQAVVLKGALSNDELAALTTL